MFEFSVLAVRLQLLLGVKPLEVAFYLESSRGLEKMVGRGEDFGLLLAFELLSLH